MPSTASHIARIMHKQRLENEVHAREFESNKQTARVGVERKFEADRERRNRLGDRAGFHPVRDADDIDREDTDRQRQRMDAVNAVIGNDTEQRAKRKAGQIKELDAARKLPDQPGGHRPPSEPEKGDPVYLLWHRMNYAEKAEWHSIMGAHAARRDGVDGELVGGLQQRQRYSASTGEHSDRAVTEHGKVNKAEHSALQGLAVSVERRVLLDERRLQEKNTAAREFHHKYG